MLTRKHFRRIAVALASIRFSMKPQDYKLVVNELASVCASTNPRFDRGKFFAACGLES